MTIPARPISPLLQALGRVPWLDVFFACILPLNILFALIDLGDRPLAGSLGAFLACVLYVAILRTRRGKWSAMALMTGAMILLNFVSAFFIHHPRLYLCLEAFDSLVMGLLFLVTVPTAMPFILIFIDRETVESIPAWIRSSSYYLRFWRLLTGIWGMSLLLTGLVTFGLKLIDSRWTVPFNYITGWPLVVVLFVFSYAWPPAYFRTRAALIQSENAKG